MDKLRENAERELKEIEKKGLSTSNIDNAHKLVEIIKGIDKIDMMKEEGGYSQARGRYSRDREDYSMDGGMSRDGYARDGYGNSRDGYSHDGRSMDSYDSGNSYRRGRNMRTGEYMHRPDHSRLSGDDGMSRLADAHYEHSMAKQDGDKESALDALEEFTAGVTGMLKHILKNAQYREEREIVQKYARQLMEM